MGFYFESVSSDIFAALLLIAGGIYVYIRLVVFQYWQRRGVPTLDPCFPFGNFGPAALQTLSIGEVAQNIYNKSTDRFIGVYAITKPILIVRDPDLIRGILIRDFAHFVDRGIYINLKDPMSVGLNTVTGTKWKNLRAQLLPVFAPARLKTMFTTILDCGASLQNYMHNAAKNEELVDVREIAACFMTDVVASIIFGLEVNSIENPDTEFRRFGRIHFKPSFKGGIRSFIKFVMPTIQKFLSIDVFDKELQHFIISMVKQTLEHREKNNVIRKDIFQLIIQLRNSGIVQEAGDWETKIQNDESDKQMTLMEIAGHLFFFFRAGFDTTSSTISYCLFEMAKNQKVQSKAQKEIDEVTARYNNQITYESLSEMKYLEACIDETLRIYPVIPLLHRECTKEYQMPGTNAIINKGALVMIPVLALQRDPQFYPNPNNFEPERFLAANACDKSFAEMPYLPFGDGPRGCIALRLGKLQAKVGLILMLQKTSFDLQGNAPRDLEISPPAFSLTPIDDIINLKVKTRM